MRSYRLLLPLVVLAACDDPVRPTSLTTLGATAALEASSDSRIVWESTVSGNADIYSASPDGTRLTRLTAHAAADESPSVSPDGRRIAFVSTRSGNGDLYVMDADGANVRLVSGTTETEISTAWSPDGATLAVVRGGPSGWDMYTIRPDGSALRRLTSDGLFKAGLDWSPDGSRIAYHKELGANYNLFTVDVATLAETRLTTFSGIDAQPSYSPDGRTIAFASTRDVGDWQIYMMDANGSNIRQITNHATTVASPDWSPDGSEIVFELYPDELINSAWIFRMRADGSGGTAVHKVGDNRSPSWGVVPTPASDIALTSAQVLLTYTPRDLDLPPKEQAPPPSATGAAYWIEGVLSSREAMELRLGRIEDAATVYSIAKSTYDVRLYYGPLAATSSSGSGGGSGGAFRTFELRLRTTPKLVVEPNRTASVAIELNEVLGVVAGALTIHGAAPGDGFVLCTYAGATKALQLLWCTPLAADGVFKQLLPAGDGAARVCHAAVVTARDGCPEPQRAAPGRNSQPSTIAAFEYVVKAGETLELKPLDLKLTSAQVLLTYTPRDLDLPPKEAPPPSATGAAYWIEGVLSSREAMERLGRIEDAATVYSIARSTYDVRLYYGPLAATSISGGGSGGTIRTFELRLRTTPKLVVEPNRTTSVAIELNEVLGVVAGALTIHGAAPGDGFVLCTYAGAPKALQLLWCTPLAADGVFKQLLPAGDGAARVCHAATVTARDGCPEPQRAAPGRHSSQPSTIAAFEYVVKAGVTLELKPLDLKLTSAQVLLTYTPLDLALPPKEQAPPPSATGAAYWIEGVLSSREAMERLGRIEDAATVYSIAKSTYDVRLYYGPLAAASSGSGGGTVRTFELRLRTTPKLVVEPNRTASVTIELNEVLGVVAGALTIRGAAPGDGFVLCTYAGATKALQLLWCTPLAADGVFKQLLPAGDGAARVCHAAVLTARDGCPEPQRTAPGRHSQASTVATASYKVQAGESVTVKLAPPSQ